MLIADKLPWYAKVAVKIFLFIFRVPLHKIIRKMPVFRHGRMQEPSYAYNVFDRHYGRVDFPGKGNGFCALELGPGDSLFSALVARTSGASRVYLVDVGNYATRSMNHYRLMADFLRRKGFSPPAISDRDTIEDLLEKILTVS